MAVCLFVNTALLFEADIEWNILCVVEMSVVDVGFNWKALIRLQRALDWLRLAIIVPSISQIE